MSEAWDEQRQIALDALKTSDLRAQDAITHALIGIGDLLSELLDEYRTDEEAAELAREPRVKLDQIEMGLLPGSD